VLSLIMNIKLLFSHKRKFFEFLKSILGFSPHNIVLYELAFIHKSASITLPSGTVVNNERLEYLGDAILDAIVADFLFTKFPKKDEGFLTQMRSKIVKRNFLDKIAVSIGLNKYIVSHVPNFTNKKHLYGNVFEAFIGAIYLDRGYNHTKQFVVCRIIRRHIDLDDLIQSESDFKSRIIEWAQKNKQLINFESQEDKPKSDKSPMFISHVMLDEKSLGKGKGFSKKEAEQNAAQEALLNVNLKTSTEIEQEST
jgi:ribonuclease III